MEITINNLWRCKICGFTFVFFGVPSGCPVCDGFPKINVGG